MPKVEIALVVVRPAQTLKTSFEGGGEVAQIAGFVGVAMWIPQ